MSEELKPCPFCGSEEAQHMNDGLSTNPEHKARFFWVECMKCECVGIKTSSKKLAAERWNTRSYAGFSGNDMNFITKCFYEEDDLPKVFIAIYSDGSGSDLFHEVSDGFYSTPTGVENVQSDWFADAGYLWFVPLPDDFEVWIKRNLQNV